jgi:carbon monoxide dehydrogenase subunit G
MKVSGTAVLQAAVDEVYAALHDPAVLVATIPGCERLEQVGADSYRMTVTAGVAAIRGSFTGEVRLTDQQPPNSFVLRASGSGAPGTVTADVAVTLTTAESGTLLAYDADAVVGGMVGGVGQRVLVGVAKKTAGEFFAAVNSSLTSPGAPALAAPEPGTTAPVDTPQAVYTRPAAPPTTRPAGLWALLAAAGAGAVTALAGVALGWAIARPTRRR